MSETTVEHFWDSLVVPYERWAEPTSTRLATTALDLTTPSAGSSVLDVAAGTGALALTAAERGHRVRAIDNSPGMVNRLTERLSSYPGCSAEVMDATKLSYGDNEFDAAFSVLGVLFFGPEAATALTEMVRVVRPGGVIGVVNWARPVGGAPFFVPLARAIERLDDPEVGTFQIPLISEYLERSEVGDALRAAGCTDVRTETVTADSPNPTPETFLTELHPFFQGFPQYRAAIDRHSSRFRALVTEEADRMEMGDNGHPVAHVNIAYGRAPH